MHALANKYLYQKATVESLLISLFEGISCIDMGPLLDQNLLFDTFLFCIMPCASIWVSKQWPARGFDWAILVVRFGVTSQLLCSLISPCVPCRAHNMHWAFRCHLLFNPLECWTRFKIHKQSVCFPTSVAVVFPPCDMAHVFVCEKIILITRDNNIRSDMLDQIIYLFYAFIYLIFIDIILAIIVVIIIL